MKHYYLTLVSCRLLSLKRGTISEKIFFIIATIFHTATTHSLALAILA